MTLYAWKATKSCKPRISDQIPPNGNNMFLGTAHEKPAVSPTFSCVAQRNVAFFVDGLSALRNLCATFDDRYVICACRSVERCIRSPHAALPDPTYPICFRIYVLLDEIICE